MAQKAKAAIYGQQQQIKTLLGLLIEPDLANVHLQIALKPLASVRNQQICTSQHSDEAMHKLVNYYSQLASYLPLYDSMKLESIRKQKNLLNESDFIQLVGIITSVPDILDENQPQQRWELLIIDDVLDEASVLAAVRGLVTQSGSMYTVGLYPQDVPRYTAVYPGALLAITGTVFHRDTRGTPSSIGLYSIAGPSRPRLNWARSAVPSNPYTGRSHKACRIHWCCGPFPPADPTTPIRTCLRRAEQRRATLVIIGGPFIKEPSEDALAYYGHQTFEDCLNKIIDGIEDQLRYCQYVQKVVLVPSPDDVTCFPILPQVQLPIVSPGDEARWDCCSNPCRIKLSLPQPSHFGEEPSPPSAPALQIVCSTVNSVDEVANVMLEKGWPHQGRDDYVSERLNRAADAVVQSRLIAPITQWPARGHDISYLPSLSLYETPELELGPPHLLLSTIQRANAFATITQSNSNNTADSERREGILVVLEPTTGRNAEGQFYTFKLCEITILDFHKAVAEGLNEETCSVSEIVVISDQIQLQ